VIARAAVTAWRSVAKCHAAVPRLLAAGYALPPLRVAVLVTHRCNLRCSMCVVPGAPAASTAELTTDELRRLIEQVPPTAVVTFTGGEPFLRADLESVLRVSSSARRVHLVTNGTLLDARWAELLTGIASRGWRDPGLVNVGVSVHGAGAIHDRIVGREGAYDRAMAGVSELAGRRRRFPLVDVKVVMTKHNVGHLVELYREARQAGADMCSFQIQSNQVSSYGVSRGDSGVHRRFPPPVRGVDTEVLAEELGALQTLAREGGPLVRFSPHIGEKHILDHYRNAANLHRFICFSTWSTLHVAPTGEVYPCFSYSMGNVRSDALAAIWNGPRYRSFRRELRRSGVFPGCIGCCVIEERIFRRGLSS
jgi:MoaA/NifB/PqqE/SkfB family radical SAM enzyme